MSRVRLATYNTHGSIGPDRRHDVARTVAVLREMDADVVALQEVESRHLHFDALAFVASVTGLQAAAGPTLLRGAGPYGNAVLARHPIEIVQRIDLSVPGCEPRGALEVTVAHPATALRVVTTHLGLRPAERRAQVRRLLTAVDPSIAPAVLMGDINEWFLWGRPLRWLHAAFRETPAPATFPAGFPMLALDRIWVRPASALKALGVHATPRARAASDHLPLVAEIDV